jgi:transcriptional regulator with XRE-family HTH domain
MGRSAPALPFLLRIAQAAQLSRDEYVCRATRPSDGSGRSESRLEHRRNRGADRMRRQIINWKRPMSPIRARARRAVVADFGRNVRPRRLAAGLRQTGLARICHVGAAFICEVEQGKSNPSLETMALLANGLGCRVGDLLAADNSDVILTAGDLERAREAVRILSAVLVANPDRK